MSHSDAQRRVDGGYHFRERRLVKSLMIEVVEYGLCWQNAERYNL